MRVRNVPCLIKLACTCVYLRVLACTCVVICIYTFNTLACGGIQINYTYQILYQTEKNRTNLYLGDLFRKIDLFILIFYL